MKEYTLEIDPRILELLGPSLYTNIYYVLAELIANAYDADAHNVYIISNKDDITVEDDGHGMSYKSGEIKKYLNVAATSRENESQAMTKSGKRRKMGRKGVGKLAALSVSENVDIMTKVGEEISGFILSRKPIKGNKLLPISENNISFEYVEENGSSIVMKNPQYRLHKSLDSIKRNLLKIFPLVDSNFKIHVIRDNESIIIDDFDKNIMKELCALITLGKDFQSLSELVTVEYENKHGELVNTRETKSIPLVLKDINGQEHEYQLKINGWIGTYKSTRGRKAVITDFPDNFLSLFANKKMGEFNILPSVGQNKLNEVYVVGQLHCDLFEYSELPDMALSNRQGYKSDDKRYEEVQKFVRDELLSEILRKRELYTDLTKAARKRKKLSEMRESEKRLKEMVDSFRKNASDSVANKLKTMGVRIPNDDLRKIVSQSFNENSPDLGIKSMIDSQKKRILISQTYGDKPFADIVYQMLLHNNVPSEDILYTNCDDEICRVPEDANVYDYLREFFVESYSTQKIYALFITSENTKRSWGAITEIGASWITQIDHKIFNIYPFRPEHPLNDEAQWQSTNRETPHKGELWMIRLNADIFCQKIEAICDKIGYRKQTRGNNMAYLEKLVKIESNN